ncbi:unnamed protein product, partial [Schistocephalus solidus]|uniref:Uncharacterized protein n=1 Tax=Schistocephalus solidus TaxID=70667 RepID=A0A183S953_SCHSO
MSTSLSSKQSWCWRHNEADIRPTIGIDDRFCHQHVLSISPLDENVVQQLPAPRPRVYPRGLPRPKAEECVGQQENTHTSVRPWGRRAAIRRSVSTSDLSSKAVTDVAARPSRQVAASVSPKKQLRADLPTEGVGPHNTNRPVRNRRAAVRRSVSTSDLPSETTTDATARPSRQMAASVSPKKQLRADQPSSKPHQTGAVKYLQTKLTGFTVHRTARQVAKDLQVYPPFSSIFLTAIL